MMLEGGASSFGMLTDFSALLAAIIVVTIVATALYPRMTQ